jgi:hypothetical protein
MKIKLNTAVLEHLYDALKIDKKSYTTLEEGQFQYLIVHQDGRDLAFEIYAFLNEKNIRKQFFYSQKLEDSYESMSHAIEEIKTIKKKLEAIITADLANARLKHPDA